MLPMVLELVRHRAERIKATPPRDVLDETRARTLIENAAVMIRRAAQAEPEIIYGLVDEATECQCRTELNQHCGACAAGGGPCAA